MTKLLQTCPYQSPCEYVHFESGLLASGAGVPPARTLDCTSEQAAPPRLSPCASSASASRVGGEAPPRGESWQVIEWSERPVVIAQTPFDATRLCDIRKRRDEYALGLLDRPRTKTKGGFTKPKPAKKPRALAKLDSQALAALDALPPVQRGMFLKALSKVK